MTPLLSSHIKTIVQLRERTYREATGLFWAEGERTILTLLEKKLPLELAVLSGTHSELASLFPPGSAVFSCRENDVKKIKATETFPGIGAVFHKPAPIPLNVPQGRDELIALDGIQDPGNLGTLFRTALWFGFPQVLLDRKSADPFHEKVVRASMGAIAGVHVRVEEDLSASLKSLKAEGYALIGTDLQGEAVFSFPAGKKILVFGNEAKGISKEILELCDCKIRIPGSGEAESLNVTVAAGIILHALHSSRSKIFS